MILCELVDKIDSSELFDVDARELDDCFRAICEDYAADDVEPECYIADLLLDDTD